MQKLVTCTFSGIVQQFGSEEYSLTFPLALFCV